jgi:hypothetical protein
VTEEQKWGRAGDDEGTRGRGDGRAEHFRTKPNTFLGLRVFGYQNFATSAVREFFGFFVDY